MNDFSNEVPPLYSTHNFPQLPFTQSQNYTKPTVRLSNSLITIITITKGDQ